MGCRICIMTWGYHVQVVVMLTEEMIDCCTFRKRCMMRRSRSRLSGSHARRATVSILGCHIRAVLNGLRPRPTLPFSTARSNRLHPLLSQAVTSVPCSMSKRAKSSLPLCSTKCIGVHPLFVGLCTSDDAGVAGMISSSSGISSSPLSVATG